MPAPTQDSAGPVARRPTGRRDREVAEHFRTFLTGKQLRMTRERQAVLEEVFSTHDHFDVEQLHERLVTGRRPVSRATIYRTLDLLVECGLVDRARFDTNTFKYEPAYGLDHHDHMVCTRCGKVIEFVSEEIERLQRVACDAHGFEIHSHRHVILGHCRMCSARGETKRKPRGVRRAASR